MLGFEACRVLSCPTTGSVEEPCHPKTCTGDRRSVPIPGAFDLNIEQDLTFGVVVLQSRDGLEYLLNVGLKALPAAGLEIDDGPGCRNHIAGLRKAVVGRY